LSERIVITGMGAVTPVGIGQKAYWENLLKGISGVSLITRIETGGLPVKTGAEVKNFKAEDFLPRKLIRETDLFMQFALAATLEALQDGKVAGNTERVGIVGGTAMGAIASIAGAQDNISRTGSLRVSPRFVPKILSNEMAAQIAVLNGFRGPCLTVSTACSSGADAVGAAMMILQKKEADAVIAVGAESVFCPLVIAGLHAARAISTRQDPPEKACRPFDRRRDGLVLGEGAGALILETLGHAERRGARVRAELIGYANFCDAYHTTAPDPTGRGEILCMQKALQNAGLSPSDIDYINAHATSTPLGDKIEVIALKSVFGSRLRKIPVSSTKGATGHLMGAGGITELIACIKAIEENIVPPTINYEDPDPDCDLDCVPNKSRQAAVRTAMSNSFGFGGQNSCLIIRKFE